MICVSCMCSSIVVGTFFRNGSLHHGLFEKERGSLLRRRPQKVRPHDFASPVTYFSPSTDFGFLNLMLSFVFSASKVGKLF